MKPINEMTLAECIARLRELPDGTVNDAFEAYGRSLPWIWDVAVDLADRIDTLLYEQAQRHDARVDALENEINALRAEYRWIPVEERLPTEEDGTHVLYWYGGECGFLDAALIDEIPDHVPATHWKRIDKPEGLTVSGQVAGMRDE